MQSEQLDQLAAALAAAQGAMENAPLNKVNPHFRSRYSDLAAIRDATVPALSKHGLCITQTTEVDDYGFRLVTKLMHASGQYIESVYPLTLGKPQEMGSQMTYAKRYSWQGVCGISADEDDDANAAQETKGNGNAPRPSRTRAEISAAKQARENTHDEFVRELAECTNGVQLARFEKEWADKLKGEGGHVWTMQEKLEKRREELNEPGDDEPDPSAEDSMEYVHQCLSVIEEAKSRAQLAEWWSGQSGKRREIKLSPMQLDGLKKRVAEKRDSLPGRSDEPYATMKPPVRDLSTIQDAG